MRKGTKVRKKFPGYGWFDGKVCDTTDTHLFVVWNDGSETRVPRAQGPTLVAAAEAFANGLKKKPVARKRPPEPEPEEPEEPEEKATCSRIAVELNVAPDYARRQLVDLPKPAGGFFRRGTHEHTTSARLPSLPLRTADFVDARDPTHLVLEDDVLVGTVRVDGFDAFDLEIRARDVTTKVPFVFVKDHVRLGFDVARDGDLCSLRLAQIAVTLR